MHHKITLRMGRNDNLPFNIQCVCGTGGDFGSKDEAMGWMVRNHVNHLRGVNTAELVDETPKLEPKPGEEEAGHPGPVGGEPEPETPSEPEEEETGDEEEKAPEEKEEGRVGPGRKRKVKK